MNIAFDIDAVCNSLLAHLQPADVGMIGASALASIESDGPTAGFPGLTEDDVNEALYLLKDEGRVTVDIDGFWFLA